MVNRIVPRSYLEKPAVNDVDWAALHHAVQTTRGVVEQALGMDVTATIEAERFTTPADPGEPDFTEVCLYLHCDQHGHVSPTPRVRISPERRKPDCSGMDCNDFLEQIADRFHEIGRQWMTMADAVERAGRLVGFDDTDDAAGESETPNEAGREGRADR